jgi:hypothetical protein
MRPPRSTFPYPPSGSNEQVNLVVRNRCKIHEEFFEDAKSKNWIQIWVDAAFVVDSNNNSYQSRSPQKK